MISAFPKDQLFTRRDSPLTWKDDPILAATQTALLPDLPHEVQEGYIRVASASTPPPSVDGRCVMPPRRAPQRQEARPAQGSLAPASGPRPCSAARATESPHITGRVREVEVSPDWQAGLRRHRERRRVVLVATRARRGWLSAAGPRGRTTTSSTTSPTSSCAAPSPSTGTHGDGENDTVYVGTGETIAAAPGYPGGSWAASACCGSANPVAQTRADPFARSGRARARCWTVLGIYRLAFNPGTTTQLAAATSDGFWIRTVRGRRPGHWTKVTAKPFDNTRVATRRALDGDAQLWVAVHSKGVWRRDTAERPLQGDRATRPWRTAASRLAASADGSRRLRRSATARGCGASRARRARAVEQRARAALRRRQRCAAG